MFTARNSSCGKVMFSEAYVKNSFHGKGEEMSAQEGFLPGGLPPGGKSASGGGVCFGGADPPRPLRDTVNKRAVRILLECILVI